MDNIKVQFFFVAFNIKFKKETRNLKRLWTNNKYTLYKYKMYVQITDINEYKAQVVPNTDNFCKVIPHKMF